MANTTRSAPATLARSAIGVAFTLLACNAVLGIEDAHVDPTLSIGETSGGVGGSSSQATGGTVAGGGASAGHSGGSAGKASSGGGAGTATGGSVNGAGGAAGQGGEDTAVAGGGTTNGGEPGVGGVGQGGEAGAGGAAAVPLCEQYCETVTTYCTGTSLQYKDLEQCLALCQMFPQGTLGDPDGNHIACRAKYAGKARYAGGTELNAYCRQAGPGGDGRCGSNCDGLCTISMATCTSETTSPYFFANDTSCHAICMSLPNIPYVYGDVSVADGNSVQCRLFHVSSAAMMDPEEHCEHVMGLTLCEQ